MNLSTLWYLVSLSSTSSPTETAVSTKATPTTTTPATAATTTAAATAKTPDLSIGETAALWPSKLEGSVIIEFDCYCSIAIYNKMSYNNNNEVTK